jgi:hypothetical protein
MEQNEIIILKTPQQPNYRLFAVASEKIQGRISEKKYWKDSENGKVYAIIGVMSVVKNEQPPNVLQYMAYGKIINSETIWQKRCPNSEFLFFLICEPMEDE